MEKTALAEDEVAELLLAVSDVAGAADVSALTGTPAVVVVVQVMWCW
jgi:hypothetical protein